MVLWPKWLQPLKIRHLVEVQRVRTICNGKCIKICKNSQEIIYTLHTGVHDVSPPAQVFEIWMIKGQGTIFGEICLFLHATKFMLNHLKPPIVYPNNFPRSCALFQPRHIKIWLFLHVLGNSIWWTRKLVWNFIMQVTWYTQVFIMNFKWWRPIPPVSFLPIDTYREISKLCLVYQHQWLVYVYKINPGTKTKLNRTYWAISMLCQHQCQISVNLKSPIVQMSYYCATKFK
jgi:hypothetical protein